MMGVGYARNMYSDLQEIIKYCTKCHLVGNFLKLIHDARNDKHKIYKEIIILIRLQVNLLQKLH
jgi:hypothetical protein